jgi:hypothetical protein
MLIETTYRDFKFRSSLFVTNFVTRNGGLAMIFISYEILHGWLHPSLDRLLYLIVGLPFGLLFLALGALYVFNSCQIEISDGQLRFRRFSAWHSVPLNSIASIIVLPAGIYLRANHAGECYRFIFSGEDFKVYWGRSPVVGFLRDVCRRNNEKAASTA